MSEKWRLKPCPFCGSEARTHYVEGYELWEVSCGQCGVEMSGYLSESEAIEAWNKRVERKSGEWIDGLPYVNSHWWVCSICHVSAPENHTGYNFCPNCGADLRGER